MRAKGNVRGNAPNLALASMAHITHSGFGRDPQNTPTRGSFLRPNLAGETRIQTVRTCAVAIV